MMIKNNDLSDMGSGNRWTLPDGIDERVAVVILLVFSRNDSRRMLIDITCLLALSTRETFQVLEDFFG